MTLLTLPKEVPDDYKCRKMVAELEAKHLVHYFRGSITPVVVVLIERPKDQKPLRVGSPRKSLGEVVRCKLERLRKCKSTSESRVPPAMSERRALLASNIADSDSLSLNWTITESDGLSFVSGETTGLN